MKKAIILGAGESGTGAAILAKKQGYDVFVSDFGKIGEPYKQELNTREIEYEEGRHSEERLLQADLVIKSPGIPDKAPIIKKLKQVDVEIIDEIEFTSRYTDALIIAITGSNGKTTTTSLTYHLLKEAGLNVGVGGNIGKSFAKQVAEKEREYYVIEVSSFQLDYTENFRPQIAMLLNITPDHLDRYDYVMQNYINSKFRIINNQSIGDWFIYNADDDVITKELNHQIISQQLIPITEKNYEGGFIQVLDATISTNSLTIQGKHNRFNAACAIAVAKLVGLSDFEIDKGLITFKNEPHRLETVATINGVAYINDSKATNVDATYYALEAMEKPIVWIVGGQDKGNDYTVLEELVSEKVKAIVALGVDNSKIEAAFSPYVKILEDTKSMKEAVKVAATYAEPGDVVLLSPACASFDLFKNYIARGEEFTVCSQQLAVGN